MASSTALRPDILSWGTGLSSPASSDKRFIFSAKWSAMRSSISGFSTLAGAAVLTAALASSFAANAPHEKFSESTAFMGLLDSSSPMAFSIDSQSEGGLACTIGFQSETRSALDVSWSTLSSTASAWTFSSFEAGQLLSLLIVVALLQLLLNTLYLALDRSTA